MNIGLVLSGGMAKGAFQIGALRAVSEFLSPEKINYISSASIGALNSFAFTAGKLDFAEKMWKSINRNKDRKFITTVLREDYMGKAIDKISNSEIKCEKLYLPVFHLKERKNIYADISKVGPTLKNKYLKAGIAVFPICQPVLVDGKYYYDGALIDNIPVIPLLKHELDYIICIYFDEYNYVFESENFDNRIIKITFDDTKHIISDSVWFTEAGTEEMINAGYKKAKAVLSFVFSDGTENTEKIYSNIELLNSLNSHNKLRITGDVAIKNLNKVLKKITNKEIVE